ncbi:hypothetical protein FACS1894164_16580 [Spirochaetia bacterium]|nr:hypothetical protein FACS1894164_16580 [Spirochaetia bacterium]
MAEEPNEVMHTISAKLYPNYLTKQEGTYIARTKTEASLSVEEVCAAATTRGKATQSYEIMVMCVHDFIEESLYQLEDGFSIETKLFSIHPKLGGIFDKLGKLIDSNKQKVSFTFRIGSALRRVSDKINIVIEGLADTAGYIGRIQDVDSETFDQDLTPGGNIVIEGHKIKVEGDSPEIGVYFINQTSGVKIRVTKRLAENRDAKIIATVPADIPSGIYRIEISTQYTKGTQLKNPRAIIYEADLTIV